MSNDKKNNYRENVIKRSEEARVVRRIVLVAILLITFVLAYIGYSAYSYINSSLQPVDPNDKTPIEVEIPLGSTSSSISEILEQNGIIKDARIFRLYTKLKNKSDFQAGMYEFTKADNFDEIIETLKSGKVVLEPVHIVTIPEGKSIDEIAELYENNLEIDKEDFLDVVNDKEYINELIDEYSIVLTEDILDSNIHTPLEGYLFPATYEFYEENPSVETVVEAMLDKTVEIESNYQNDILDNEYSINEILTFASLLEKKLRNNENTTIEIVVEAMLDKTVVVVSNYLNDILDNEYSVHEIFTFASLLEKESRNNEERKIIAGVFYNRLDIGMPLQTDPSVLYALGEHKERGLYEDLEVD